MKRDTVKLYSHWHKNRFNSIRGKNTPVKNNRDANAAKERLSRNDQVTQVKTGEHH